MAAGAGAWVRPFRDGFRVYYRKEPGAVLGGSRVFPTQEAAEDLAEELRGQINRKRRIIEDAIEAYLDDMKLRNLREVTITENKRNLRTVFASILTSPLAVLTPRKADALYTAHVKSGKYGTGTQHLHLSNAKTFGEWCAHPRRRWFKENPFKAVERVGERPDHRSEHLHVNEARGLREKMLDMAARGDFRALMTLIALTCSLGPSEINQIEARDVDDDGGILWVCGKTAKTVNRRRSMEIADPQLRALLARHAKGKTPDEKLFPFKRTWLSMQCQQAIDEAGVRKTTLRELRRTFASLTARSGRSLDDLAFSMGHGADSKATTAQRFYTAPGAKESGQAGRLFGVLDGGKKQRRTK